MTRRLPAVWLSPHIHHRSLSMDLKYRSRPAFPVQVQCEAKPYLQRFGEQAMWRAIQPDGVVSKLSRASLGTWAEQEVLCPSKLGARYACDRQSIRVVDVFLVDRHICQPHAQCVLHSVPSRVKPEAGPNQCVAPRSFENWRAGLSICHLDFGSCYW